MHLTHIWSNCTAIFLCKKSRTFNLIFNINNKNKVYLTILKFCNIISGILKNAPSKPVQSNTVKTTNGIESASSMIKTSIATVVQKPQNVQSDNTDEEPGSSGTLPEGFFDDPKMDAKVCFFFTLFYV